MDAPFRIANYEPFTLVHLRYENEPIFRIRDFSHPLTSSDEKGRAP